MPTSDSTDAVITVAQGGRFSATRTHNGIVLDFPVLRAPGAALSLGAFAMVCGLLPAIGLSALLPITSMANATAMLSLALFGGLAAPFLFAAIVFAVLAIYHSANSLHVEIDAHGIRTVRRVFGRITRLREIARDDIARVEPRISARYQNAFSATPRYTLVAHHRHPGSGGSNDVVVAEDLAGQALMAQVCLLLDTALGNMPLDK